MMSRIKKFSTAGYILFLVLAFFYVRYLQKSAPIAIQTNTAVAKDETKAVKTTITLNESKFNIYNDKIYTLSNDDSISTMLSLYRSKGYFVYEKTVYTDHVSIDSVNKVSAPVNFKWAIMQNGVDLTNQMDTYQLGKGGDFQLKLIPDHS